MIQPNAALPVIDWNYTKLLSSKATGLTEDLLQMFLQQLPIIQTTIQQAFDEQDFVELAEQLHKLQGSCTYCGLTRMADFVAQLSHALKQYAEPEQTWLIALEQEIEMIKTELVTKGFKI